MSTITETMSVTITELAAEYGAPMSVERVARLAWTLVCEPGDVTAGVLIDELGAVAALDWVLGGGEGNPDVVVLRERVLPRAGGAELRQLLRAVTERGYTVLIPSDAGWPAGLVDLGSAAPYALYVAGDASLLTVDAPRILVSGCRAATGYGEHAAMEITAGLVARGHIIFGTGSYGIAGMAHRAALASGGKTVVVSASGLGRGFPSGHDALLARIAEVGAIVSEVPPHRSPTRWTFIQRGRLAAALTDAVLVVEAGVRSGSLNEAAHAGALGRPVGAVPGPITSVNSDGCVRLIREFGATLISTTEHAAELTGG